MPLPSVSQHSASQCTALSKGTKQRCLNPAAHGCKTCRVHGARKQNSIKRGEDHPNYLHGMETLIAKDNRKKKLAELRVLEVDLIKRGLMHAKHSVGRKHKAQESKAFIVYFRNFATMVFGIYRGDSGLGTFQTLLTKVYFIAFTGSIQHSTNISIIQHYTFIRQRAKCI